MGGCAAVAPASLLGGMVVNNLGRLKSTLTHQVLLLFCTGQTQSWSQTFFFFFTHSATISARFKLPHAKTERQKKVCSQPCIPLPLSHPPSSYLLLASSCWSQWVMQTAFQNMFKYTWYLLCDSLEEPHLRLSSTTNCKHSHWRQRQCSTWKYCVVEEVVILLQ